VAVVGSDSGAIPRTIEMTAGVVYPQGDVERLAAILGELLRDPARRKAIADAGRRRVLETFTTEAVASSIYQVIMGALERYRASRRGSSVGTS
ncbi:MAG: glycosyltransferase, partial [Armatimonadetes bacterium]|nr:glycosyltransferase [Armatimonadota bacterium]